MISVSHFSQRKRFPAAVGMLGRIPNARVASASRSGRIDPGSVPPMTARVGEPQWCSVEHEGLTIGALDWGGHGPPLVLLHPNGFCAGVFDPLARALLAEHRVIGID